MLLKVFRGRVEVRVVPRKFPRTLKFLNSANHIKWGGDLPEKSQKTQFDQNGEIVT